MRPTSIVLSCLIGAMLLLSPSRAHAQRGFDSCVYRGNSCSRYEDMFERAERARTRALERADRLREQARARAEARVRTRVLSERAFRNREIARDNAERIRDRIRERARRSRERYMRW